MLVLRKIHTPCDFNNLANKNQKLLPALLNYMHKPYSNTMNFRCININFIIIDFLPLSDYNASQNYSVQTSILWPQTPY